MTEEDYEELHDAFERWSDAEWEEHQEELQKYADAQHKSNCKGSKE